MDTLDLAFIKERRKRFGIPMREMAEHMHMSNASEYMKYENGTYAFKAKQLPLLAEALNCEISDFFTQNVAELAMN